MSRPEAYECRSRSFPASNAFFSAYSRPSLLHLPTSYFFMPSVALLQVGLLLVYINMHRACRHILGCLVISLAVEFSFRIIPAFDTLRFYSIFGFQGTNQLFQAARNVSTPLTELFISH